MYPKKLLAGTIIRIGQRRTGNDTDKISNKAVGLEFEVGVDSEEFDGLSGIYKRTYRSKVTKNPNGWEHDTVSHEIDLQWDTIVSGVENKYMKHALDHIEN
jgi:hypothetical protein